jgi:hypothetical protein
MSENKLIEEILKLSESNKWSCALIEWDIKDIYLSVYPGTCLCSHSPIYEHCILTNKLNGNSVIVGNHCVKRFNGESDSMFKSIHRVIKDIEKPLNLSVIAYSHDRRVINNWEFKFYTDTMRKQARTMSEGQLNKRVEINKMILHYITKNKQSNNISNELFEFAPQ